MLPLQFFHCPEVSGSVRIPIQSMGNLSAVSPLNSFSSSASQCQRSFSQVQLKYKFFVVVVLLTHTCFIWSLRDANSS